MLGMKTYDKRYIDYCRARIDAAVSLFRKHVGNKAAKDFDHRFFNDQVLLLDYMFVHRLVGIEGKDGNALNEVRVLCNSLLFNGGKLQVDKLPGWPNSAGSGVKLPPDKSMLGLPPGRRDQPDRGGLRTPSRGVLCRDRGALRVSGGHAADGHATWCPRVNHAWLIGVR